MRRFIVLLKNIINMPLRIFSKISIFSVLQETQIDKTAAICSGVRFYRGKIGKYSYIGNNSFVSDTDIGAFTSISTDCYIGGAAHPMDWASTSPVFHKWENILKKNFAQHEFKVFNRTTIGNDVWIGNKAMIKAGVKISDGAIIGMGSVVTKDVGAYEIWAGNPATMIRKRFSNEKIELLLNSKWWEKEDVKIERSARSVTDVEAFIREVER